MTKTLKILALLLVFILPAASFADEDKPYKRLYVFGDSLSDTGNLATITGAFPNPPYFGNRVTNGYVAVEVMAERLGLPLETSMHLAGGAATGNNYAVVAARAGRNELIDLSTQVALFLANHGGVAPADTLYVMFIGGNDIRKARDSGDWATGVAIAEEAATIVANQIQVLAMSGAKNWLVVNAPDIGRVPETALIATAYNLPALPATTTALSVIYNDKLKRSVKQLEEELDIETEYFNLYKLFGRLLDKSDKLGFTNNTDPCFSSEQGQFTPGCAFGFNFNQYVFFDEIHPTARIHAMVGEAMYRKVADDDDDDKEDKKEHEQDDEKEVESADD
ncbi:MAG: SGNH/GDSL hydrolase family protein [Gammaproteobacteria bacterium]|nr:SGNH/GDSL hydrolase family protein [Gammaproteobacteria bacterium]